MACLPRMQAPTRGKEVSMNNLTGLELRKACCEALGWRQVELLAIESDIGVAWPIFVEWCEKNEYGLRLHSITDGSREGWTSSTKCICWLVDRDGVQLIRAVNGATLSEVIARAIVEISK
jgi:hypothetical protein